MDELSRRLMMDGNLKRALWDLQNMRLTDKHGKQLPALEDLLRRVQEKKKQRLEQFSLDSVMDDLSKSLEDVINTEREGIRKQLEQIRQRVHQQSLDLNSELKQRLLGSLEEKARQNLDTLDRLPSTPAARIRNLNSYDFMEQAARSKYKDLMNALKKRTLDTYARELSKNISSLDQETLAGVKEMLESLNSMLQRRMQSEDPGFSDFMQQYGDYFGQNAPRNLDDLIENMQKQAAQAQSLLNSFTPEQRESLLDIIDSVLDDEMKTQLARLGVHLRFLSPEELSEEGYPFSGNESIGYDQALQLMEELQKMESLENQIQRARYDHDMGLIRRDSLKELLGEQTSREMEALSEITKKLEESGYIQREKDECKLTPRGMRKIGEKALNSVFARLKRDRSGSHNSSHQGSGGERIDDTRQYEYGDDFDLHLGKTLMNALKRHTGLPVKLLTADFEVYKEEQSTRCATALLLDMSLSMPMRGNFQAAKTVAIALDTLIRGKYPKDSLYILGFSSYARRMSREDLTYLSWDDFDPYTNMQHGLNLARKLLEKDRSANKQIILISDGEPTAHTENGRIIFQFPPSYRCIRATLDEVVNCTRSSIVINTFMLKGQSYSNSLVNRMARLNSGRIFFTEADDLGEYLIIDYMEHKQNKISR